MVLLRFAAVLAVGVAELRVVGEKVAKVGFGAPAPSGVEEEEAS
jgi:hypothetical protein